MAKPHSFRKGTIMWMGILFVLLSATGCGRQEVSCENSVVEDNLASKSRSGEGSEGVGTLRASLGIGEDEKWEENFEFGEVSSHINAKIYVPEDSQMYTEEVSEYYYTAEDKKKIAEYFLEPDSIKVDVNMVPTKDVLHESIQLCKNLVAAQEADGETGDEHLVKILQQEQERLKKLLIDAPNKEEIEENVDNYHQDYYAGIKDGIEYSLVFNVSEENNRSVWQLQAKEAYLNEFVNLDEKLNVTWCLSDEVEDNKCSLTEDEAVHQAAKICEELGFTGLKPTEVDVIVWELQQNPEIFENNGYRITFQREIGDIFVDVTNCFVEEYFDAETMERTYNREQIVVWLNDCGIYRVSCQGVMSAETPKPAKLLGFDQIKEIFVQHIQEFTGDETETEWNWIGLEYVRLRNEQNADVYSYVPAWRFGTAYEVDKGYSSNIWINALDGSVIDMEQQGDVLYYTLESYTGIDLNGVRIYDFYNVQGWD